MWYSYRGPSFGSQYLYCSLPPSVAPVLGDPMSSSDCHGHQAHMVHTHAEKKHIYIKINIYWQNI